MTRDDALRTLPTRRQMLRGGAASALLPLAGPAAAAPPPAMTVYRDRGCGCCLNWAALARRAGYAVNVVDSPDMAAVKRRLGVPRSLMSCHTAVVGGYAIEGHVPFASVARLLQRRPRGVRGLAVPGMPLGSPGMEVPGVAAEPFQVFAFDAAGRATVFR